jgi:sigma-B regulation protein RsbU (phosphoserine phosphatase)
VLELKLEPGDVLVMLTDGILEAESPQQQMFGDGRALEVVRAHLHLPAAAIVDALHEAACEFCQARSTKDDITSLVVKVGDSS